MNFYLERFKERMEKEAKLRNSSIELINKYNMRYEDNPQNSGLQIRDKEGGLVAKLTFGLLPFIEIFQKDHPIIEGLKKIGYYPATPYKRIVI